MSILQLPRHNTINPMCLFVRAIAKRVQPFFVCLFVVVFCVSAQNAYIPSRESICISQ